MTTKRIQEIQNKTPYPNSVSIQQALLQVWNECEQEKLTLNNKKTEIMDYTNTNPMAKEVANLRHEDFTNHIFMELQSFNIEEQTEILYTLRRKLEEMYRRELNGCVELAEEYKRKLSVLENLSAYVSLDPNQDGAK